MITKQVTKCVWQTLFLASGKSGGSSLLRYAGPAILVSILFTWIMALLADLVLLYEDGSVVNSRTMADASALEKLYYAGFTLSTLCEGDFIPSGIAWHIVTSVAAFAGLLYITTSITYFGPCSRSSACRASLASTSAAWAEPCSRF